MDRAVRARLCAALGMLMLMLMLMAAALVLGPAPALAAPMPSARVAASASGPSLPLGSRSGASRQAWASAAALTRGINLAVYAAPREGDWGLRMDDRWIDALAQAGFRTVRLSVRWSNHATSGADAQLDEAFASRIDRIIDALIARQLNVVMNVSFYSQLDGQPPEEGEVSVDAAVVRPRFLRVWRQLAERHARRSPRLLFELYNAPRGDAHAWNQLAAAALAEVRRSSPARIVVIGAMSNEARNLPLLELPRDPHLIVAFHNREPRRFTSQGSPWVAGADAWLGTDCCDAAQLQALAQNLDRAQAWSIEHGYPVWLGSFGAVSTAPMASRARYLRAMRDAAEARGISWAHADFAANFNVVEPPLDSGVYDVVKRQWHRSLLEALLGP